MFNLLPVTTGDIVFVAATGGHDTNNSGHASTNPVVLSTDAVATIAQGITDSVEGGTILIYPGTYAVSVSASKSQTFLGINREACIISTAGGPGSPFIVNNPGIELENITLTHVASASSAVLSVGNEDRFVARHVTLNLTASASTRSAFSMGTTAQGTKVIDMHITSDASGMELDGEDTDIRDVRCVCSANDNDSVIGILNKGLRTKLIDSSIFVTNVHTGSTGVIGIENDTTTDADMFFVQNTLIHVIDDHASASFDSIAVKAEKPMMLEFCDLNVRVDGTGDAYGVQATDDVLLVNCNISSLSVGGTAYSISVSAGKTVTCIGCTYDRSLVTGAGTVIDLTDVNGRVDVATVNGATPMTAANITDNWEAQSQADPSGFHVNVLEWVGDSAMDIRLARRRRR